MQLLTGEAVNVSSGLGFNGYDDKGRARWDLVDNADIWKIEVKSSYLSIGYLCNKVVE